MTELVPDKKLVRFNHHNFFLISKTIQVNPVLALPPRADGSQLGFLDVGLFADLV